MCWPPSTSTKSTRRRASRKAWPIRSACALEIHAQLEEEIFYPALRAIADTEFVEKSVPEHDQMRRLITQLRNLEPADASYDETFFELMNIVMHHVADEETCRCRPPSAAL